MYINLVPIWRIPSISYYLHDLPFRLGIFAATEMALQNDAVACVVAQPQEKIVETATTA